MFGTQEAIDAFLRYLREEGNAPSSIQTIEDFETKLKPHVQIQLLNNFLTRGLPKRTIKKEDWGNVLENLLKIQPAEQLSDTFSLSDSETWNIVEIPATVAGVSLESGNYVSESPIQHVHGMKHGVQPEYVSMGIVIARNVPGHPSSMVLVNIFQDWVGFSHCFCAVELEKKSDGSYGFVSGTFHPGQVGLIHEKEAEFLGFLESYFKDQGRDGDLLPGKWLEQRKETRLYRPGADELGNRATLTDVFSGQVHQWDDVVKLMPRSAS